jgi:hypothetical protein
LFISISHEKQILIVISLSLFFFIGYNVLTVEAAEKDDKKVCEDYNGEWKSTGDDDRGCVFEKDSDAEKYGYRPGFSLDSTGSDAEYGIEDLVTYDNEGNKVYPPNPFDETDSSEREEEKAAQEDALCDNEDADTTDIDICKSHDEDGKEKVEDWRNEVEPTDNIELKSPTITVPIDDDGAKEDDSSKAKDDDDDKEVNYEEGDEEEEEPDESDEEESSEESEESSEEYSDSEE